MFIKSPRDAYVFSDQVPAKVVLERYFGEMYPKSRSKCFSTKTGLCTKLPFPNIIKDITLRSEHSQRTWDTDLCHTFSNYSELNQALD